MIKGKKAMTVSIPIVVFLTLLVTMASLFYFNTVKADNSDKLDYGKISMSQFNQRIDLINFIIQDAVSRAASISETEEEFIGNYNKIINEYKYEDGTRVYSELDNSLADENNVVYSETSDYKTYKLTLNLDFKQDFMDGKKVIFSAENKFTNEFSGNKAIVKI